MPPRGYSSYRPVVLPAPPATASFETANPAVEDVLAEYRKIGDEADFLRAHDGNQIPEMRYTADPDNGLGRGNQFNGIQRLNRGPYLVIAGGDPRSNPNHRRASHVFVVKMDSRPSNGAWGSNIVTRQVPPASDAIVRTIGIDRTLWRAGGISVSGDILAVPIQGSRSNQSRVVFYNMRDPEHPQQFNKAVKRSKAKARAVALAHLPNQYHLLAVCYGDDTNPKLDFYLSKSRHFADGFGRVPVTWHARDVAAVSGQKRNFISFQTINFVSQTGEGLYLFGFHNTSPEPPTVPGSDYADLYRVDLPNSLLGDPPQLGAPVITKVASRQFFCVDQQCNMGAGAGVYVDPNGALNVYVVWHWRSDSILRFNEYRSVPDTNAASITRIRDAWVDLFEHEGFKGRRFSILGKRDSKIPHFGKILVQGTGFRNKVRSVRFQIPKTYEYVLYEDEDFAGVALALRGSGNVEEIRNLPRAYGFGDRVASARYEP